jgi:hypothetical protein
MDLTQPTRRTLLHAIGLVALLTTGVFIGHLLQQRSNFSLETSAAFPVQLVESGAIPRPADWTDYGMIVDAAPVGGGWDALFEGYTSASLVKKDDTYYWQQDGVWHTCYLPNGTAQRGKLGLARGVTPDTLTGSSAVLSGRVEVNARGAGPAISLNDIDDYGEIESTTALDATFSSGYAVSPWARPAGIPPDTTSSNDAYAMMAGPNVHIQYTLPDGSAIVPEARRLPPLRGPQTLVTSPEAQM